MRLRIRELREQAQLTQQELADRVLISQPYLAQLETGIKIPNVYTAKNIADVLGVTVDELIVEGD